MNSRSLSDIMKTAHQAEMAEGDFMGDDGLLRCGKCGEPKEMILNGFNGEEPYKMGVMCQCELDTLREREEAEKRASRARDAAKHRGECFAFDVLKAMTFSVDDRSNPKVTGLCESFAEKFAEAKKLKAGLLLYGAVGGGKTFHAACIANAVIDEGYSARFTNLSTLASQMGANFGRDKQRILNEICRYDLVVLDDLGIERSTEAMSENAYQIVNALYMAGVVLIFTTNVDKKAMQEETDPALQRIYSRIFERCQPVKVDTPDRRRKITGEKLEFYKSLM